MTIKRSNEAKTDTLEIVVDVVDENEMKWIGL